MPMISLRQLFRAHVDHALDVGDALLCAEKNPAGVPEYE
jgi:hypothetical protein